MKRLLLQLCVAVFFMSSLCPFCFADFAKAPPPESTSAPAAASTPEQARTLAAAPAKEPPPAQAPAASVAPKFFTIISPLGTSTTALDETIRLQIDGNRPVECKDLTLLLGDYPGLASGCTPLPGRQFLFTLGRGDKNHEAWRGILGKPLAGQRDRELPVYLAVSQTQLEHMNETPGSVFVRRYITGLC